MKTTLNYTQLHFLHSATLFRVKTTIKKYYNIHNQLINKV